MRGSALQMLPEDKGGVKGGGRAGTQLSLWGAQTTSSYCWEA